MRRTRGITFEIEKLRKLVDFGTYALMMYYAKQIDANKGKKLFDATLSEYAFRVEYELPIGNLDPDENLEAHFVPEELQNAIQFIDCELSSALENESQHLIEKYGGRDNFLKIYYENPDYLIFLGVQENEFYEDHPSSIISILNCLREIFEYALSVNRPYKVDVY